MIIFILQQDLVTDDSRRLVQGVPRNPIQRKITAEGNGREIPQHIFVLRRQLSCRRGV